MKYNPEILRKLKEAEEGPSRTFDTTDELMAWLDEPEEPKQDPTTGSNDG